MGVGVKAAADERIWETIRAHLEGMRNPINEEIRKYPLPIPACDLQYNHLLEERDRISRELMRLKAMSSKGLAGRDLGMAVEAFIDSSSCIDDETAQRIKATLSEKPA
jgi:hypothetical protein